MELNKIVLGCCHGFKVLCLLFTIVFSPSTSAQDIPLFTQKLTNSFLYNPALAGDAFGSFTYSYRKNYSEVKGAPQSNFLSLHAPFSNYRFGAGVNFFQEEINVLTTTYASAAFAYHLYFDHYTSLSMGVSGEYNNAAMTGNLNFLSGSQDPTINALQNGNQNHYDFAAGINYQARFFKVGMSANRLTGWWQRNKEQLFNKFLTAYAQGLIPVRYGRDLIEPGVAIRKLSETSTIVDVSIYYTLADRIILGSAYRSGRAVNTSAAFNITPSLLIGYSYEVFIGNNIGYLGNTNEIVLRYDFIPPGNRRIEGIRRYAIPIKYVRSKTPQQFHRINDRYVRKAGRYMFDSDINGPSKKKKK